MVAIVPRLRLHHVYMPAFFPVTALLRPTLVVNTRRDGFLHPAGPLEARRLLGLIQSLAISGEISDEGDINLGLCICFIWVLQSMYTHAPYALALENIQSSAPPK